MYLKCVVLIILCGAQSVSGLGPQVEIGLYVIVPVFVFLILAIAFRLWWEWCRGESQFVAMEETSSHVIVNRLQNMETPATQQSTTRGVFKRPMGKLSNRPVLDTYRLFENHKCRGETSSDSPSPISTGSFDFETNRPARAPLVSTDRSVKSCVPSTEMRQHIVQSYPTWEEIQEYINKDNDRFPAHHQNELRWDDLNSNVNWANLGYHINSCTGDRAQRLTGSTAKPFPSSKKTKSWKFRFSKPKVYKISDPKPHSRKLFPRFKSRRYTTSTSREVDIVCDTESYSTINNLCASLQKAFEDYHKQFDSNVMSTSHATQAPLLKSCLKQRSGQRKGCKHVRFKVKSKSSIFKTYRKVRSPSKSKQNKIFDRAQADLYIEKWSPVEDSRRVSDAASDQTFNFETIGGSCGSRNILPSERYPVERQSKPESAGSEYTLTDRNVSKQTSEDADDIDAGYRHYVEYYTVAGDIYYSGHHFQEEITGFDRAE